MKSNHPFVVTSVNNKFIVTKNGVPFSLPSNGGQKKITEFDNKEDADRYINILLSLTKNNGK